MRAVENRCAVFLNDLAYAGHIGTKLIISVSMVEYDAPRRALSPPVVVPHLDHADVKKTRSDSFCALLPPDDEETRSRRIAQNKFIAWALYVQHAAPVQDDCTRGGHITDQDASVLLGHSCLPLRPGPRNVHGCPAALTDDVSPAATGQRPPICYGQFASMYTQDRRVRITTINENVFVITANPRVSIPGRG